MPLVVQDNDVRVAHDGQQCLTIAQTFQPGHDLLDLGTPSHGRMDSVHIRASLAGAEMRLVAPTGWGQPQDCDGTAAAGFDARTRSARHRRHEVLVLVLRRHGSGAEAPPHLPTSVRLTMAR